MTSPGHTKYNIILPAILVGLLGVFVIFFRFNSIPKTLTFDEIEFAKLALSLGKGGYVPYSPLATGHATLYFYVLLFSLKTFGISSFALRLPSALFGVLSVLVFYFVLHKAVRKMDVPLSPMFHTSLVAAGAFLFSTTRWFFNFARFGFEGTLLLLLELSSLLFFLHYMDKRKKRWLIISGLFAGLAFNSYQPGRIFFILPLALLFFFLLERKQHRLDFSFFTRFTATTFLSFLVPFMILATPLSVYLSQNKDVRLTQLMYPSNSEMSAAEKFEFFGRNIASTTFMFTVRGDVNGRHNYPNKPALNPLMSVLFVGGFIFALMKLKNKMNQLFVFYFFISVAPTLLTYPWENPNMLRTITSIPAIVFFSIYTCVQIYLFLERKYHIRMQPIIAGIFVCICLSALYDLRTYYVFQTPVFKEAFEASMPLSYYINNPNEAIKK